MSIEPEKPTFKGNGEMFQERSQKIVIPKEKIKLILDRKDSSSIETVLPEK